MTRWKELVEAGVVATKVMVGGLTTYKLGGPTRFFAEPKSLAELQMILEARNAEPVPLLVIGRGSNLVVSDRGFDGIALRLSGDFSETLIDGASVTAGAAVSLPVLARTAARASLGGLEFFVGIPGSVGGAIVMNAGCFGTETADVLDSADILDLNSGEVRQADSAGLEMTYRSTNLSARDLVVGATFRTVPSTRTASEARMREITRWRKEHQPGGTLNAGSVFKNPPGDAAGRIIDALGLKGFGSGKVRVSERHANFFVAESDASAQDVWNLVHAVQRRVRERTGVELEPEIRFVGQFEPVDEGALA